MRCRLSPSVAAAKSPKAVSAWSTLIIAPSASSESNCRGLLAGSRLSPNYLLLSASCLPQYLSGRLGILPTACLRAPLPLGRSTDGFRPLQPTGANTAGTPPCTRGTPCGYSTSTPMAYLLRHTVTRYE